MYDKIKYPTGFGLKNVVAWGTTGLVVVDESSQTVIKTPLYDDCEPLVLREQEVYQRLSEQGGHPGILRYHGTFESGFRLEYAPNGDIRTFYAQRKVGVDSRQRLRWATQIAEALAFVHRARIVHGDLTCHNIFLDKDLNAKLADFAGSSLDGSELLIAVTASHEYPGPVLSTQGDIFAFGSVMYEIMTGNAPYTDLSEEEISSRYSKGEFPDTASLGGIGIIIRKCWVGQYNGFDPVLEDLRGTTCYQQRGFQYGLCRRVTTPSRSLHPLGLSICGLCSSDVCCQELRLDPHSSCLSVKGAHRNSPLLLGHTSGSRWYSSLACFPNGKSAPR